MNVQSIFKFLHYVSSWLYCLINWLYRKRQGQCLLRSSSKHFQGTLPEPSGKKVFWRWGFIQKNWPSPSRRLLRTSQAPKRLLQRFKEPQVNAGRMYLSGQWVQDRSVTTGQSDRRSAGHFIKTQTIHKPVTVNDEVKWDAPLPTR